MGALQPSGKHFEWVVWKQRIQQPATDCIRQPSSLQYRSTLAVNIHSISGVSLVLSHPLHPNNSQPKQLLLLSCADQGNSITSRYYVLSAGAKRYQQRCSSASLESKRHIFHLLIHHHLIAERAFRFSGFVLELTSLCRRDPQSIGSLLLDCQLV